MTEARWKIVHARLVESLCTDGRGTNSPHAHIRWCRVVERCPEVQRRTDQEVADANGLPTGGVVGMGQARGGGQENNLIHTKAESALPHHNPRGSGANAASTGESRRPKGELEDSYPTRKATVWFSKSGGGGSAVPKIREDGVGQGHVYL